MRIKADLDDIGDVRRMIEPGTYNAKLTNVEEAESSNGNPMLVWDWRITTKGEFEGEDVRSWTSMQSHALFAFKQHLLALDPKLSGSIDINPEDFIGRTVVLKIGIRKYKNNDGEERESNNVVKITASKKNPAIAVVGTTGSSGVEDADVPF
jgi:hypothetical protein